MLLQFDIRSVYLEVRGQYLHWVPERQLLPLLLLSWFGPTPSSAQGGLLALHSVVTPVDAWRTNLGQQLTRQVLPTNYLFSLVLDFGANLNPNSANSAVWPWASTLLSYSFIYCLIMTVSLSEREALDEITSIDVFPFLDFHCTLTRTLT